MPPAPTTRSLASRTMLARAGPRTVVRASSAGVVVVAMCVSVGVVG